MYYAFWKKEGRRRTEDILCLSCAVEGEKGLSSVSVWEEGRTGKEKREEGTLIYLHLPASEKKVFIEKTCL